MDIKSQEYKDFSLRLHEKALKKPIMGQFELTHRCNLDCQHCYIVNDSRRRELTYSELCRIFDEVKKEGCLWLCFTGGEPLLREDFLDIYSYAYRKGFFITIFTNATLFNEKLVKYLSRFPPFCIEVTLNGVTKNTYELITRRPSSFEAAMRGIELIREFSLPLKLKCQAMTLNINEIHLMREFYDKMQLSFRCSTIIDARMDGSTQNLSLRLPIEKISELKMQREVAEVRDGECSTSWDDILSMPIVRQKKKDDFLEGGSLPESKDKCSVSKDELFRCPGGTWAFYVNPYGELYFCNWVRKPSWDLRNYSFKKGFYEFFPEIRAAKFETDSECRYCEARSFCLSCPGKAYLETGDREAPLPYYCELAKKKQRECVRP